MSGSLNKGEFELIGWIKSLFSAPEGVAGGCVLDAGDAGVLGIGDDCAVIPQQDGKESLVSTDMLMEGVHFLLDDISAYDLGWKAAAVNISDIAAMGGLPTGSFLAFALPPTLDDDWRTAFLEGYRDLSLRYGCPLLGGDTTASKDRLCICVTVLGETEKGKSLKRSGAKPGDLICVSGNLGDSAAGLQVILDDAAFSRNAAVPGDALVRDAAVLRERHHRPLPQVEAGLLLSATEGVHAMMDISDGLASDLRHILEASEVSAEVDTKAIPLSPELLRYCESKGADPLHFALEGGEDYQLLFTASPEAVARLQALLNAPSDREPHAFHVIGRITPVDGAPSVTWLNSDRDYHGYRHF